MCKVTLRKPIFVDPGKDNHTFLLAQKFPSFGRVSLRNKCVLTCDEQSHGLGGILAFKAKSLLIDKTSKIDMSGKGKNKVARTRLRNHDQYFNTVLLQLT